MSASVFPVRKPAAAHRGAVRRGFTLLEVLLAVSLSAMLLVSVNFFVLSLGELWSGGSETRLFERHVRGVARFLDSLVEQSVVPETSAASAPAGLPGHTVVRPRRDVPAAVAEVAPCEVPMRAQLAALARGAGDGLAGRFRVGNALRLGSVLGIRAMRALVQSPGRGSPGLQPGSGGGPKRPSPGDAQAGRRVGAGTGDVSFASDGSRFSLGTPAGYDGSAPMLMFEVDEAPGQCVWPGRPLPQVECALQINADEGLVLLWKSKLEEDYGKARPRKTQLSPFARGVSYDYYDTERQTWTHTEQPQSDGNGGWVVPQRIRVAFAYHGMEREISITLPEAPGGAPLR